MHVVDLRVGRKGSRSNGGVVSVGLRLKAVEMETKNGYVGLMVNPHLNLLASASATNLLVSLVLLCLGHSLRGNYSSKCQSTVADTEGDADEANGKDDKNGGFGEEVDNPSPRESGEDGNEPSNNSNSKEEPEGDGGENGENEGEDRDDQSDENDDGGEDEENDKEEAGDEDEENENEKENEDAEGKDPEDEECDEDEEALQPPKKRKK